ncbi:uncharacterized protein LOC118404559 [Branchiostoma floridae]|uniref:Uncharacterized protein LOC118404559 n=1 Tax=Branchiostoma floridae TaxID=7739 RepID=C3ZSR1_BRAFL|nr:uncharacterized protein LOC118404559 [Branchiostoma floridae]|eukprot:XP_002588452.1 hypothetical protein BRAFLDRAFT_63401 [Branchiostoma floridae]
MVSLKMTTPQQRVGQHENPAFNRGDRSQTRPKMAAPNNTLPKVAGPDNTLPIVTALDNTPDRVLHHDKETPPKEKPRASDNTPDRVLHLKEETSPEIIPRASQVANKRCNCKSALSSTSPDKATRPKALATARQREDVRRSVSLDESTHSEPHSLCSNLPDSVSCPGLDEMISGKSVTRKEPQAPRVSTPREGRCEERRLPSDHHDNTGRKAQPGLFGSMETITEDTAHIVKKKTPVGNQNGRTSLNVEALSLGGNKVATTIVQMIKKQLVDKTHFDLPYSKFSALCLRLYNTGSNWKILAGKLGLTVEDVLLIDNCSAQHGLLAAEIVLRHWQRTAGQDGTAPCNLHNLQGILVDMGREDLVEMLTN